MPCGLLKSTKIHFASLGIGCKVSTSTQDMTTNPTLTSFPDSRFLSAARKCQNPTSPHLLSATLRIHVPKQGLLKFSSTYTHAHTPALKDLIQTFLDEYGTCSQNKNIMEVCSTEIKLESELEELVGSLGGCRECCSVRIARPELGCRISLDGQTEVRSSRWKRRERQVVCLALESLSAPPPPSSPTTTGNNKNNDNETPTQFQDLVLEPEKDGIGKAKMGKVYVCWEWKTVRMGGCTVCWGTDFVVDAVRGEGRGRPCLLRRVMRKVGVVGRGIGRRDFAMKGRERVEPEQELKPLLI